jgi:tetratricopeptide (TPR) repeat protein
MANALDSLCAMAENSGAYDEAKQFGEKSLAIHRILGDQRGIAGSLLGLSIIATFSGQLEEAERLARESNETLRQTGDRTVVARGLTLLGGTLVFLGKYAEGHSWMEEGVTIDIDLGFSNSAVSYSSYLGIANLHLGRYKQAHALGQMGLDVFRKDGRRRETGHCLLVLGSVMLLPEECRPGCGEKTSNTAESVLRPSKAGFEEARETYAEAQSLLQESIAIYQDIGHRDARGVALATLGYAARGSGSLRRASQHLRDALRIATECGAFRSLLYALPAVALRLADLDEKERAVELYALASRYPLVANSRWFEDVAGRHVSAVAATLPPDVVAAAQERGRQRDLWATGKELLAELKEQLEPDTL